MKSIPDYLAPTPYRFPYNGTTKAKTESRNDFAFLKNWYKEHGAEDPYASAKTIIEEFFKK